MIVTFGFTGIITSGTDNSGIFDAAGTNLTGKPFALSISVDDTKGLPTNGVGGTGIASSTPAAVIAIDGKNYVFSSSIVGQIDRGNSPGPSGSLSLGFSSSVNGDQFAVSISSFEDGAPYLATDNWKAPFPLYTLVPFALQVPPSGPATASGETQIANFAINNTGKIASGTLNIQTVSETVAANAPAMAFISDNPTMLAASTSSIGALDVVQNAAPPLSAADLSARMFDIVGAAGSLTLPTPLSIDGTSAMASITADLRSEMSSGIKIDGSW